MANDLKSRLQDLHIDQDKRPDAAASERSGGFVRRIITMAILGAIGWFGWQNRAVAQSWIDGIRNPPVEVATFTVVARRPLESDVVLTASGKVVTDHQVSVATKVSGQIEELFFEQGDYVKKDQLLARIENTIYVARRDEAAAILQKDRANARYQQINYQRVERLYQRDNSNVIEFAAAMRDRDESVSQVAADEASLRFAQKQVDDCNVLAPIAGVILYRQVEIGDFVAAEGGRGAIANAELAAIADMTHLRVEVDINELDIKRIKVDMPCRVTPDAYADQKFDGHVMWLDPSANYAKSTVQVKVRIHDPDPDILRVEGTTSVIFLRDAGSTPTEDDTGIWIPLAACQSTAEPATAAVWIVSDSTLRRTAIRLGETRGDFVRVTQGLSEGQSIAAKYSDTFNEGQRIAPPAR